MPSTVLAVARLAKKSNIPADMVENTFVFTGLSTPPLTSEMDALGVAVADFYNGSHSHTAINENMSASLSTGSEVNAVTFYLLDGHLDGSPHGAPIYETLWTLGGTDTSSLPDEVAVVVSYQRPYGSDVEFGVHTRPRARDRGRLYIGPWGTSAITTDATTKEVYVASGLLTDLEHAALDLITNSVSTPWSQWSRRNATVAAVTNGWVDDRFDSQRRRSQVARFRGLW